MTDALDEMQRIGTVAAQMRKNEWDRHQTVWLGLMENFETLKATQQFQTLITEEKLRHKENKANWQVVWGNNGIIWGNPRAI